MVTIANDCIIYIIYIYIYNFVKVDLKLVKKCNSEVIYILIDCGNHFMMYTCQIILYIQIYYSFICQLHLNKSGKK